MRDRGYRRAQTERYKAKQYEDVRKRMGKDEADRRADEVGFSKSRHTLDCGRRCLMCHADKILDGNIAEKREGERQITLGFADYIAPFDLI